MIKHLLATFSIVLCVAMAAQGADSSLGVKLPGGKTLQPVEGNFSLSEAYAAPLAKRAKRKAGAGNIEPKWGKLVEIDNTGSSQSFSAEVTLTRTSDSTLTLTNIAGTGGTLYGTYDVAAGTVSITPGAVYNYADVGNIWACSIDFQHSYYYTNVPISGIINADGSVTLNNWGLFITSGQYANYSFGAFRSSDFRSYNATEIDTHTSGSSDTTRVYAMMLEDNDLAVFNFAGQGQVASIEFNGGPLVSLDLQQIYTEPQYGMPYVCRPADYSKSANPIDRRIVGTGTSSSITLGNWGIYLMLGYGNDVATNTPRQAFSKSVITLDSMRLTYPVAPAADWNGGGTEGNPYIITKASQLQAMANAAMQGETYEGKCFALGNDIDMSVLTVPFVPIGESQSNAFEGSFDGRNFTIRSLMAVGGNTPNFGLFGYAGAGSVIKNLTLNDFIVDSYANPTGTLAGQSYGTIHNVKVTAADLSWHSMRNGGVVGIYGGNDLSHAFFSGKISATSGGGGVVSSLTGKATFLAAHGTFNRSRGSQGDLGGVVADIYAENGYQPILADSYSDMVINDNNGYSNIGGLVGSASSAIIERCFSSGTLSSVATNGSINIAPSHLGGLVGDLTDSDISDCFTTILLSNSKEANCVGMIAGYVESEKGGLISFAPSKKAIPGQMGGGKGCHIKRTLALGQADVFWPIATMPFYGQFVGSLTDTTFVNVYFDRQLQGNAFLGTDRPKFTTELTGTSLPGFDPDVWQFSQGSYPVLRSLASDPASIAASAPVYLDQDEQISLIKRDFSASTAGGVYWKVLNPSDNQPADEDNCLKISGSQIASKGVSGSAQLRAYSPDGSSYKALKYSLLASDAFSGGKGSKQEPYLISKVADWQQLASAVASGMTFENNYFRQTNDINFTDSTFNGVGNGGVAAIGFSGDFDGGNYQLKGLNINTTLYQADGTIDNNNSPMETGLFGIIHPGARVHNIVIDSTSTVQGLWIVGAITGSCDGTVDSCYNYGTVISYWTAGAGISGYVESTGVVSNCVNNGHVMAGWQWAAGIAGFNHGRVEYCQNNGLIEAKVLSSLKTSEQQQASGIVAYNENKGGRTYVIGNINYGTIVAPTQVAGIVGGHEQNTRVNVQGNINLGTLVCDDENEGWLSAVTLAAGEVSNNYNDAQIVPVGAVINASLADNYDFNTRQFTSGTALEGLDASHLNLKQGQYPVVAAAAADSKSQALRQMVVTLPDGESLKSISKGASLNQAEGLTWSLLHGTTFAISGDSVKAVGDQVLHVDTLTATLNGFGRQFRLLSASISLDGAGTRDNPYQIRTIADLQTLAHYVTDLGYGFNGQYLRLMNDIEYPDSITHTVIGTVTYPFGGDFDGAGHSLKNVKITGSADFNAVFASAGATSRIHNLTVASGSIRGGNNVGAIVGRTAGTVANCTNHATISATGNNVGGLVGDANAATVITGCQNSATVTASGNQAGGIVGNASSATITLCENTGNVTGNNNTGGIGGLADGTIADNVNSGAIKSTSSMAGGITGNVKAASSVARNVNSGAVNAPRYAGGIYGYNGFYAVTVDSCRNSGAVTAATNFAGGIIGFSDERAATVIKHCVNTGAVTGTGKAYNIAGIVGSGSSTTTSMGDTYHMTIDSCANLGTIIGNYAVAGIVGIYRSTLSHSYNVGDITSNYSAGGLIGYASSAKVNDSFNGGNVTATSTTTNKTLIGGFIYGNAGGLTGTGYLQAVNVFNTGTVTGTVNVGGFSGTKVGSYTRCYQGGKVVVAGDTSNVGILMGDQVNPKAVVTLVDVCYDAEINAGIKPSSIDANATPLSTRDLVSTKLGDAWNTARGFYPSLKEFADNPAQQYATATVYAQKGETLDHLNHMFNLGMSDSITWIYPTDLIQIGNCNGGSNAAGDAILTKSWNGFSKSYNLHFDAATGFSGIEGMYLPQRQVSAITYYNVAGQQSARPFQGTNIVVTRYTDGTTSTVKTLIK